MWQAEISFYLFWRCATSSPAAGVPYVMYWLNRKIVSNIARFAFEGKDVLVRKECNIVVIDGVSVAGTQWKESLASLIVSHSRTATPSLWESVHLIIGGNILPCSYTSSLIWCRFETCGLYIWQRSSSINGLVIGCRCYYGEVYPGGLVDSEQLWNGRCWCPGSLEQETCSR